MFFAPFPEEEISNYLAHGPFIRVSTGIYLVRGKLGARGQFSPCARPLQEKELKKHS